MRASTSTPGSFPDSTPVLHEPGAAPGGHSFFVPLPRASAAASTGPFGAPTPATLSLPIGGVGFHTLVSGSDRSAMREQRFRTFVALPGEDEVREAPLDRAGRKMLSPRGRATDGVVAGRTVRMQTLGAVPEATGVRTCPGGLESREELPRRWTPRRPPAGKAGGGLNGRETGREGLFGG